jgi:hypothetical protein
MVKAAGSMVEALIPRILIACTTLLLAEAMRVPWGVALSDSLAEEDLMAWAAWVTAMAAIKQQREEQQF